MSIKKILISQQQPMTASPYTSIAEKFGVQFDFKPFFKMEPLSSREFRAQRISLIGSKHKGENFLIATAESTSKDAVTKLFETQSYSFETATFVKPVAQDLKGLDIHSYDLAVLFNPADVKSLFENYPDFKQENLKFVSYGKTVVPAMEEAGLSIEISAPTVEAPSVAKALEIYLSKN